MFGCPPSVAAEQDWRLVMQIADYRAAREAVRAFNAGADGLKTLMEQPAMLDLLIELARIQTGNDALDGGQLLGAMARNQPTEDEDE